MNSNFLKKSTINKLINEKLNNGIVIVLKSNNYNSPNSDKNLNSTVFNTYVNLVVDDEIRYNHINVRNIYEI